MDEGRMELMAKTALWQTSHFATEAIQHQENGDLDKAARELKLLITAAIRALEAVWILDTMNEQKKHEGEEF